MALLPSQKNSLQIVRSFRQTLSERTGIQNFDRDSKSRALIDPLANELVDSQQQLVDVFNAVNPSTATGSDLEAYGRRIGLEKRETTFAISNDSELNLAFHADGAAFGSINDGNPINIPAGTIVRSTPNNNELGQVVQYRVVDPIVLAAGSSFAYATIRAEASGSGSNVGSGVLVEHNFTSYATAAEGYLKVINSFPILNGRDPEVDEQYRFRIANHYPSLLQSNEAKIRLASLRVPGVLDVKVVPGYFGIGTVAAIILGPENQSVPSLISAVQQRLNLFKVPGLRALATSATEVTVSLELEIKTTAVLTALQQKQIRIDLRRTLLGSLVSVPIGGTITLDGLVASIQQIGMPGFISQKIGSRPSLFKSVLISRSTGNQDGSEQQLLIGNVITLDTDEYCRLGSLDISFAV